ncbi:MAG: hypothetical protein ACKO23_11165, partial [Gemmataceae bacterium]
DEIWADGKLDRSELEFLLDLKRNAKHVVSDFNHLLFSALKAAILADGEISEQETVWLRKFLNADGKIDQEEKKFLEELKSSAKKICPEFQEFFSSIMKS